MGKHILLREYLVPNRTIGCICYCDKLKKEVSASIGEDNTAKCSWCGNEFKAYVTGCSKEENEITVTHTHSTSERPEPNPSPSAYSYCYKKITYCTIDGCTYEVPEEIRHDWEITYEDEYEIDYRCKHCPVSKFEEKPEEAMMMMMS